ncbi:MAG: ABC transporter permease [Bacteroidota bacterium]
MDKILLIIRREYLTRVRKKAFIILTLVGPLFFAAIMIIPVWASLQDGEHKSVLVLDNDGRFANNLKPQRNIDFSYVHGNVEMYKEAVKTGTADGLLIIPKLDLDNPSGVQMYFSQSQGLELESGISNNLETIIENEKLVKLGYDKTKLESLKPHLSLDTKLLSEEGESESNAVAATAIGMISGVLIYFFIFMYGVQVMRGVIEEKTNRIIEVMISSVKPFQLMMGKIVGVALVGLTQFLLWVVFSSTITFGVTSVIIPAMTKDKVTVNVHGSDTNKTIATGTIGGPELSDKDKAEVNKALGDNKFMSAFNTINFGKQLACFLFYFLGGYLLYSSLFAAVGSAVDSETDTQQFMLPLTVPLILSFVTWNITINNPDGNFAFWMSIIPFTSPVSMMLRLPFNPPVWQIALSMVMLVLGFLGTVWIAGRIYRVGILMYGKKITYREISKWLFYKA